MTVHDIEMQPVGPTFFARLELIGQPSEIGSEEAWRDMNWSNSAGLGLGSHGRDHTCQRILNLDVPQRVLMLEDTGSSAKRMLAKIGRAHV